MLAIRASGLLRCTEQSVFATILDTYSWPLWFVAVRIFYLKTQPWPGTTGSIKFGRLPAFRVAVEQLQDDSSLWLSLRRFGIALRLIILLKPSATHQQTQISLQIEYFGVLGFLYYCLTVLQMRKNLQHAVNQLKLLYPLQATNN